MAGGQCLTLLFFLWNGAPPHLWWGYSLLALCFVTGLFGGAIYVNTFSLIAAEVAPSLVEFSLGAACVGESLGIMVADVAGLVIQGCLYEANGIGGATLAC